MPASLFATKPLAQLLAEAEQNEGRLRRVLGPVQLTSLGIGAVIGAGIFVTTGAIARQTAGPALMLSYVVAGLACLFAALCYCEFAGMVPVAEAHAAETSPDQSIKALLRSTDDVLLPGMAIKEAVLAFDRAESEALAVVDSYSDRRVIGLLTEAYALRRYTAELERRRKELIGDE